MATIKKFLGYVWPAIVMFILCHLCLIAYRWCTHKVYVWAKELPSWDDYFSDLTFSWGLSHSGFLFSLASLVFLVLAVCVFIFIFAIIVINLIALVGYGMRLVDALCPTKEHRVAPLLILVFYGYTCLSLPLRYTHLLGTRKILFEMILGICVVFIFATAITFMLIMEKEREQESTPPPARV